MANDVLVTCHSIAKTFGSRALFEELDIVVEEGERIGLIGPNGAGKSTLLKILSGEVLPDQGNVSVKKGLKIGVLEQTPRLDHSLTVEETVLKQARLSHGDSGDAQAGEILSKLDLNPLASKKIEHLSGGWRKRTALARELVKQPGLLLLDEPTNHLDIESILWLEQFLTRADFATVTITHDRLFLQRVATRILELDKRNKNGILSVKGDYSTYLDRKEILMNTQIKQEAALQNRLRRETEWLRQGAKARTTKQQARIQAAAVLKDEVEDLENRNRTQSTRIDFLSSDKKPKRLIEAKKITKTINGRILFKDLDLFIGPDSRIGLLGTNGCGKSTLIRALMNLEPVDSGTIIRSEHLKVTYFEQNREALDPKVTLRKTLCPRGDEVNFQGKLVHIQGYLDRFLFKKEQTDMQVGYLSGGEQSRVLIAKLMLEECNVLVLDEPTNDLDVETLDVLQNCLDDFDGAVILVTHDRYFLDQVSQEIHAFPAPEENTGRVISFSGLAQWENWRKEKAASQKETAKKAKEEASSSNKKKKMGFNETRELSGMEEKIHRVEAELASLEQQAQAPENTSHASKLTEIYQAISEKQAEIEKLYARWAELEAMR